MDKMMTEAEVMRRYDVSRTTLWRLRKRKKLPHYSLNKLIRYDGDEIKTVFNVKPN